MAKRKSKTLPAADVPGALDGHSDAALKRALKSGGQDRQAIHPVVALDELKRRQTTGLSGIMRSQLSTAADPAMRASAAAFIGSGKGVANRTALIDALQDESPDVVRRAVDALGLSGDADALAALRSLRTRKPVLRRSINTARTFLAYSLGETQDLLKVAGTDELLFPGRRKTTDIGVDNVDLEVMEIPYLVGIPGFEETRQAAVISCGSYRYLLVFNYRAFKREAALLQSQSCIAAVLLRSEVATGKFFRYASVLTRPAGGSMQVDVVRNTGQRLYTGTLSPKEWRLTLSALNTSHTFAIRFTGNLDISEPALQMDKAEVAMAKAPNQPGPKRPTQIRIEAGK